MMVGNGSVYILGVAAALALLSAGAVHAEAPQHRAGQPPSQLSGSVQVGVYNPLDFSAQSKLWLTRFTAPSMLINVDVAFVYDRDAFCALTSNLGQRSFHTSRFAIARREAGRFEVGDALQVKKGDFCAAASQDELNYVVLSKDYLGQSPPRFLINWATAGAIKGLAPSSDADNSVPDPNDAVSSAEAAGRTAAPKEIGITVLELYALALEGEGVTLKYSSANEPTYASRYCVKDLRAKNATECFDTFSQATERMLSTLRAARKQAAKPLPQAEAKPVRYELSIVDTK